MGTLGLMGRVTWAVVVLATCGLAAFFFNHLNVQDYDGSDDLLAQDKTSGVKLSTVGFGKPALRHTLTSFPALPITADSALAAGYKKVKECDDNLGVEYHVGGGPATEDKPVSLFFTKDGKIAGVRVTAFDKDEKMNFAQGRSVKMGYWQPVPSAGGGKKAYSLTVSFRKKDEMCADSTADSDPIGDQLVVNQGLPEGKGSYTIPLTADAAYSRDRPTPGPDNDNLRPGSCMKFMGQHYYKLLDDLDAHGSFIGDEPAFGNLMPVAPMYHTREPKKKIPGRTHTKKINAFFVNLPQCQNDSGPRWDNVPFFCALTAGMYSANFCEDERIDFDTKRWATMHFVFNDKPDEVKCPDESFWNPIDTMLQCPANTPKKNPELFKRNPKSPKPLFGRNQHATKG